MTKRLSLILDILCAILWIAELIKYCVTGTITPVIIIVALITTILYFIQSAIVDFPKK